MARGETAAGSTWRVAGTWLRSLWAGQLGPPPRPADPATHNSGT